MSRRRKTISNEDILKALNDGVGAVRSLDGYAGTEALMAVKGIIEEQRKHLRPSDPGLLTECIRIYQQRLAHREELAEMGISLD